MKRILLFVSLLTALFVGGASVASSASAAANCVVSSGATQYDGFHQPSWGFYYGANFTSCTDITAVRVVHTIGDYTDTGWWDVSVSGEASGHICPSTGNLNDTFCSSYANLTITSTCASICQGIVSWDRRSMACWFSGSHTLQTRFHWQIRNISNGQWGPVHEYLGPTQSVSC